MPSQIANPGALWASLVTTATVGVDRVGAGKNQHDDPCETIFGLEGGLQPAEALLDRVAALSVYAAAGRAPDPVKTQFAPVADDLEPCGAKAGSLLLTILNSRHASLLNTWCKLAREQGQRVPHALLAAVLNEAVKGNRKRDDDIAAVIGTRGRWLAAQNKRWAAYAVEPGDTIAQEADVAALLEHWETGSKAQRIELMKGLRAADPAAARDALMRSLSQESAADRAALAGTLAVGLSVEDEPALEAMLDDRSIQVREVAADLLSLIEGSALSQRMVQRLDRVVAFTPAKGRLVKKNARFDLNLPDKQDDKAKRDAISEKAAQRMGAKAAALSQIVGRTPLAWWEQKGPDAGGWLELGLANDWSVPLIIGWARAAHLQRDADWSAALIGRVCLASAGKRAVLNENWRAERLEELITHLDKAQVHALIESYLPADTRKNDASQLIGLLRACPGPWSVDLSRRVLAFLQQAVKHPGVVYDNTLRAFIDHVAGERIAVVLADDLGDGWPTDAKHWSTNFEELVDRFIRTVGLRQQMHAAFENQP